MHSYSITLQSVRETYRPRDYCKVIMVTRMSLKCWLRNMRFIQMKSGTTKKPHCKLCYRWQYKTRWTITRNRKPLKTSYEYGRCTVFNWKICRCTMHKETKNTNEHIHQTCRKYLLMHTMGSECVSDFLTMFVITIMKNW